MVMIALPVRLRAEPSPSPAIDLPSAGDVEANLPAGERVSGRELYDRFLKNKRRLRTARQEGRIVSADPGGNPQLTRYTLLWKDYRDEDAAPVDDVLAKVIVRFVGSRDLEHTAYLYVDHRARPDDQFMYSPMRDRVTRVNVRGETVAGTDLSVDDFLGTLDDVEDATYRRLPDDVVDGAACYVVEATMRPSSRTTYRRSVSWLDKERYVPLRTRYWDDAEVAVKELTAPRAAVKEFDGVWVPTESTMTDLLEATHSTVYVDVLEPNPPLGDDELTLGRLQQRF